MNTKLLRRMQNNANKKETIIFYERVKKNSLSLINNYFKYLSFITLNIDHKLY